MVLISEYCSMLALQLTDLRTSLEVFRAPKDPTCMIFSFTECRLKWNSKTVFP